MSKTDLTEELEQKIWLATNKMGVFGCREVTIGWYGKERVDYLTYDTKGIWRCYEIKVTKTDFRSKAAKTFIGHYNYYVMPWDLYQEVKDEIPAHIGVYSGSCEYCTKKAKRQELGVDEKILFDSMIRSLNREADKLYRDSVPLIVERYKKENDRLQSENRNLSRTNMDLRFKLHELKNQEQVCVENVD